MIPEQMRRALFGYDRDADLNQPHAVNWNGLRVAMGDVSSGLTFAHRLNNGVVLSEMSARARRPYGTLGLSEGVTDEERRWGMPCGTGYAQSAERSRRAIREGK